MVLFMVVANLITIPFSILSVFLMHKLGTPHGGGPVPLKDAIKYAVMGHITLNIMLIISQLRR